MSTPEQTIWEACDVALVTDTEPWVFVLANLDGQSAIASACKGYQPSWQDIPAGWRGSKFSAEWKAADLDLSKMIRDGIIIPPPINDLDLSKSRDVAIAFGALLIAHGARVAVNDGSHSTRMELVAEQISLH